MEMIIRLATKEDLTAIRQLFYETITTVALGDYTEEEVAVWASGAHDTERWEKKFDEQEFYVACIDNELVGFTSLLQQDYVDHMYVSHKHQGKGIASKLVQFIEDKAKSYGVTLLKSDVSITARPFFEHKGYKVVKRNEIPHKGQVLINFDVIKEL